ncbi:MAG: hypothetical protein Q8J90_11785, partial [Gallionella sp.]|nr:hypothetical protein [Gallionella sp.]
VARDRDGMGAGISCAIDKITGQTSGQTMVSAKGIELFSGMSQDGIRAVLQKMDSYKARIFSEDSGSIEWKFRKSADS